jgi:murein DD-endopeptidase MepM/ murein hydrolase activator NlpD
VDPAGDGHFGAPRGDRTHNGIDYLCVPGEPVRSPVEGNVTKHGYPYEDDLSWRYIEITDGFNQRHRLFYTKPLSNVNELVAVGQVIGEAQNISKRYEDRGQVLNQMKPHVHYEVINGKGEYIDPETAKVA